MLSASCHTRHHQHLSHKIPLPVVTKDVLEETVVLWYGGTWEKGIYTDVDDEKLSLKNSEFSEQMAQAWDVFETDPDLFNQIAEDLCSDCWLTRSRWTKFTKEMPRQMKSKWRKTCCNYPHLHLEGKYEGSTPAKDHVW